MLHVSKATQAVDVAMTGSSITPPDEFIDEFETQTRDNENTDITLLSESHTFTYRVVIRNTHHITQQHEEIQVTYSDTVTQTKHCVTLPNAFTVTHLGDISITEQ